MTKVRQQQSNQRRLLFNVSLIGLTLPDSLTFSIVSGLLDIAHQQTGLQENIYQTLWSYARCIVGLTETNDSKDLTFLQVGMPLTQKLC
jgi:hypothetical protein